MSAVIFVETGTSLRLHTWCAQHNSDLVQLAFLAIIDIVFQDRKTTSSKRPPTRRRGSGRWFVVQQLLSTLISCTYSIVTGTSPGAGLESAFDQADAAFADLIVTSIDSQGIGLDDEVSIQLLKGTPDTHTLALQ